MHRRLRRVVFALTVAVTAVFAHIAIDVAGDFLLARDAYDDVAHHSRESLFSLAIVLLLVVFRRTLRAAHAELQGSRGLLRRALRSAVPASRMRFVAAVALATIPALLAMAGLDALLDGRAVDDGADLLGGSVGLGLTCAFASALFFGTLTYGAVRAFAKLDRAILRLLSILAQRSRDIDVLGSARSDLPVATLAAAIRCARSVGLRAPPLPLV